MTTPVKPINKKVGVLKMGWLAVRDVLIELATVIIYYAASSAHTGTGSGGCRLLMRSI